MVDTLETKLEVTVVEVNAPREQIAEAVSYAQRYATAQRPISGETTRIVGNQVWNNQNGRFYAMLRGYLESKNLSHKRGSIPMTTEQFLTACSEVEIKDVLSEYTVVSTTVR